MSPAWMLFGTCVTVVLAFAGVVWLRVRTGSEFGSREWEDALSFSIDRYRPMERLLCLDDAEFLRNQPGFESSMLVSLRRDRRRVFRSYLRSIRRDFEGLYLAARQSVLLNELNNTGLLQAVIRQRMLFYFAFGLVEARLALYTLGLGTVDVRPVLDLVEAMRQSAVLLRPAPMNA